jgi:hypothetical protein
MAHGEGKSSVSLPAPSQLQTPPHRVLTHPHPRFNLFKSPSSFPTFQYPPSPLIPPFSSNFYPNSHHWQSVTFHNTFYSNCTPYIFVKSWAWRWSRFPPPVPNYIRCPTKTSILGIPLVHRLGYNPTYLNQTHNSL